MVSFPNSLVEAVEPLETNIGDLGNAALSRLNKRGFVVATGLTEYFAGAIGLMGYQQSIREYCPKDSTTERFATLESTSEWLQKGEEGEKGRAMFLLLNSIDKKGKPMGYQLEGYGWTGVERSNALPEHPITSAFRIGERVQGTGLGKDFIQTIISGTNKLYAPGEGIGLETWKSNRAAGMYLDLGFVLQSRPWQAPELRPTLNPRAKDGKKKDIRQYMAYPTKLLES
jgi:hypothetical protein